MKLFPFDFQRCNFYRIVPGRSWFPPLKAGFLFLLLVLTQSCAVQRIADGRFVQETKGYSFMVPGANWEIDKDAWVYEREFGEVVVKRPESKFELRNRRRRSNPDEEIDIRPRRKKPEKKLILDMDIGFKHKTHPMTLLVGTISEGDLVKFVKGKFVRSDSDLPENLIAGYMERLQFLYSRNQPGSITTKSLPNAGTANRLEWNDGYNRNVLYGIALTREYLFVSLRADKETSESAFREGVQALDQLAENSARFQKN